MSTRFGRRRFLGGALATTGGLFGGPWLRAGAAQPDSGRALEFPKGFSWGTATSAYQIEGGTDADGRGESIWDRFSHARGKTKDGQTGDIACDHYHRWQEDIGIMRSLGVKSYRFSISWPRIQPEGRGGVNQKGVDFYSRLVDALLKAGIRPFPTLYHWDLPQALEDLGGWPSRDTASRFAEYASIAGRALGDRVRDWILFNEPNVFVALGYFLGLHAPGRTDPVAALRASHVVNLAQGEAFRALKAERPSARVGGAWNLHTVDPKDPGSEADKDAARRWQLFWDAWYLDPALRGRYPDAFPAGPPLELMGVEAGDLERTRAPFDFIGINHYSRQIAVSEGLTIPGGPPGRMEGGSEGPSTDSGWEVWPRGFFDVVSWVWNEYGLPIEITENGCCYNDLPGPGGVVPDAKRTEFYRAYLSELHRAIEAGAKVVGYHAWSLLDNFEWAEGYSKRFGLVYVDFATQKRVVKDSGRFYSRVAGANALVP